MRQGGYVRHVSRNAKATGLSKRAPFLLIAQRCEALLTD